MNTLALLTNNPQTTYEKKHKKLEKDHVTLTMPTWGMGPGYSLYTANQLTELKSLALAILQILQGVQSYKMGQVGMDLL